MADNPSLSPNNQGVKTAAKPLSQLQTPKDLEQKLEALKRGRELVERQWKLNLAFYKGKQYSYFSKASRRVESLPVEDGDKPRYRVRITSNQIISGCQSLLAKLLKTKPRMMASPGSGSDSDLRAAEFSEKLLEYWWDDMQLDDSLEEACLWSCIGGQGYWHICWDDQAGKSVSFLIGPDGQPIMDEGLKDMFMQQLEQHGIPPQQTVMYMGDIRVDVVSPFDLYVDPTVKKFSDAKYVIHSMYLDQDEVKSRYKADISPDSVPSSPDVALPMGGVENQDVQVVRVNCMYVKPHAAVPRGRIVTWAKNQILEDKPWDYPSNELPFVKFPGIRIPGEIYDSAVVEHAIPLQKELNRTLSQIVEFKNLGVKPQWMAPAGSLRQRRTDEPGAIFEFNPVAGMAPAPIPVPALPAYIFNHLQDIQARLADVFGRMEVTEGNVPPNVEAGVAIDLLQEMATDKMAPQIRLIELALERAGQMMLDLAKRYYIEPRLIQIRGAAGSQQVKQFTQSDLTGAVNVKVEAGSGLPRTRAGRQARIESFIGMGLLEPRQAWRYLDMADLHGISDQFEMDEDQAYREHEALETGQPLSMYQVVQAQQQIQEMQEELLEIYGPPQADANGDYDNDAGTPPWDNPQAPPNPDTGAPFQSWEDFQSWAQQAMHKAMIAPTIVDNHEVHLDVHSRIIKGMSFNSYPPEVQQAFIDHINAHREILFSFPANTQGVPPKVSLQLKSTVGPTEQSEILKKAGIFTTPDEASEPPRETWVTEQVAPGQNTDGTMQDGGQGEAAANMAATAAQSANQQAQAQLQQQVQAAQAQAQLVDQHQKAQHQHELHHHALRAAKAKADAAEHQARHAARPPASPGKGK